MSKRSGSTPNGEKYCPALTEGGAQGQHIFEVVRDDDFEDMTVCTLQCKWCREERLERFTKPAQRATINLAQVLVNTEGEFDPRYTWANLHAQGCVLGEEEEYTEFLDDSDQVTEFNKLAELDVVITSPACLN